MSSSAAGDTIEPEIEQITTEISSDNSQNTAQQRKRSVSIKSPEVEIHLYRSGRGPAEIFKARLGGWDQDQLEVRDILDKYGLKSIYACNPSNGTRGVPIRFNQRNGRSIITYADSAVIHLDGEPKDSLVKPITKILVSIALITLLLAVFLKEQPQWLNLSKVAGGNFPPWILALAVIVFARLRKRTKNFLKKYEF